MKICFGAAGGDEPNEGTRQASAAAAAGPAAASSSFPSSSCCSCPAGLAHCSSAGTARSAPASSQGAGMASPSVPHEYVYHLGMHLLKPCQRSTFAIQSGRINAKMSLIELTGRPASLLCLPKQPGRSCSGCCNIEVKLHSTQLQGAEHAMSR